MNIALNNAGDAAGTGTDKVVRKSHHYMPVNFSFALKYHLNNRFGLETGLSYSRLKSDFEMGSNGNTINEHQTIRYLGIPMKGIYKYNFTPNIGLFAEPSLQYYIPTGTQIETYRTEHPFTFSLPIGIRFTW